MIAASLIHPGFVRLDSFLSLEDAMHLFEKAQVFTLPVVSYDDIVIGYLSLDVLISSMSSSHLSSVSDLHTDWLQLPVLPHNCHYFELIRLFNLTDSDCLAIIDESNKYVGYVSMYSLNKQAAHLFSVSQTGAILVLSVSAVDYSLVELSRLIENHDIKILGLEILEAETPGMLYLHFKLNTVNLRDIIATLERFDYVIHAYFLRQDWEDDTADRYKLLMHFLED